MSFNQDNLSDLVLDAINAGVLIIDREYRIKYANKNVREKLYSNQGDLVGKNLFDLTKFEDQDVFTQTLHQVASQNSSTKLTGVRPITYESEEGLYIDLNVLPWHNSLGEINGINFTIKGEHNVLPYCCRTVFTTCW